MIDKLPLWLCRQPHAVGSSTVVMMTITDHPAADLMKSNGEMEPRSQSYFGPNSELEPAVKAKDQDEISVT